MEDISMDYDLQDDPVKRFLLHKLEEIRLNNAELDAQLNRRKQMVGEYMENVASKFSDNLLEITETWSRIFNSKWIIGILVRTTNSNRVLTDLQPILQWNNSSPLVYATKTLSRYKKPSCEVKHDPPIQKKTTKLIKALEQKNQPTQHLENEWIFSNQICGFGSLIISLDLPDFIENTEHCLSGIITYNCSDREYHLPLPNFVIKAEDLLNDSKKIKSSDLVAGDEISYLSICGTNDKHNLVMKKLPPSYSNLHNLLEFECMFLRINRPSKAKLFYVNGISTAINGTIIHLEDGEDGAYRMIVFSRNHLSLQVLLHFLHQHIPGIIILPEIFKHDLEELSTTKDCNSQLQAGASHVKLDKLIKEFGASIKSQIEYVENFCTRQLDNLPESKVKLDTIDLDVNISEYKSFMKELAQLEFKSDKLLNDIDK